jgi:Carboxypeptidase regulatory-like domain
MLWRFLLGTGLLTGTLVAQLTKNQEISGQIVDSSGSAVLNATVTVVNPATAFSRSAHSNESGNYVISNLPIGVYDVSVEAQGFKKSTFPGRGAGC